MTTPFPPPPPPPDATALQPLSSPPPHTWWGRLSPASLAAGALLAAAVAGFLLGVVADRAVVMRRFARMAWHWPVPHGPGGWMGRGPPGRPGHGDAMRRHVREQFAREYGLTPEQTARVDTIMQRRDQALEALHAQVEPQARALLETTHREIDSVLTPEQRARFDTRWPDHGLPPPPPPRGP
jgi:Spy/CpxP family protein refolding chaperone